MKALGPLHVVLLLSDAMSGVVARLIGRKDTQIAVFQRRFHSVDTGVLIRCDIEVHWVSGSIADRGGSCFGQVARNNPL